MNIRRISVPNRRFISGGNGATALLCLPRDVSTVATKPGILSRPNEYAHLLSKIYRLPECLLRKRSGWWEPASFRPGADGGAGGLTILRTFTTDSMDGMVRRETCSTDTR